MNTPNLLGRRTFMQRLLCALPISAAAARSHGETTVASLQESPNPQPGSATPVRRFLPDLIDLI